MGTLRTILSITVVLSHSYGFIFIGGRNSVQLFYIISGFLISYILNEAKSYNGIRDFYLNRYLRIFPIYFTIAVITFTYILITKIMGKDQIFFHIFIQSPLIAKVILITSNAAIFFQDWVMFLGIRNENLEFMKTFNEIGTPLSLGILIPQAWTLGVELSFYAIAPFIVNKNSTLFIMLFISILIRVYIFYIGLGMTDPWTYRFFPSELSFFLLGVISHKFMLPFYVRTLSSTNIKSISVSVTSILFIYTISYHAISLPDLHKMIFLFLAFSLSMPLIFIFQNNFLIDRKIGELSYPIYICHWLAIKISTLISNKFYNNDKIYISILSVLISIVLSLIINKAISDPIERIRNKIKSKQKCPPPNCT